LIDSLKNKIIEAYTKIRQILSIESPEIFALSFLIALYIWWWVKVNG
jgi:hypothetical protein